jgi:hypothetical protein
MLRRLGLFVSVLAVSVVAAASSALGTFGAAQFGFSVNQAGVEPGVTLGPAAVQAGSHPFGMTTRIAFHTTPNGGGEPVPDGNAKDIEVALPAGIAGDPGATPKCTNREFTTQPAVQIGLSGASCSPSTQVGVAVAEADPFGVAPFPLAFPVYNLVPPPGVPAAFGFNAAGLPLILLPRVRTSGDYGLTASSRNTSQMLRLFGAIVTLWGVPSDPVHDAFRGECLGIFGASREAELGHPCPVSLPLRPLLTLPTACPGTPLTATLAIDSWQEPGALDGEGNALLSDPLWKTAEASAPAVEGCERLDFSPSLTVQPETTAASTPTGLLVHLHIPQNDNPTGLAEAQLREAVVQLPEGMGISAAGANGLAACTGAQIALHSALRAKCPEESKIGTVEIHTPVLEQPLAGSVYLARPANPFKGRLTIYVVAEGDGVAIKLAGRVEADPGTGRLTTRFEENPQQPFEDLELSFFGGPRAPLTTPSGCGVFETTAALTPYSSPAPVPLSSPFSIETGCNGGFAPSFVAGSTSSQAGAFSSFTTTLSRGGQEQQLGEVTVTTPPGLLGLLTKVQLCGATEAERRACPEASRIGHVTVGAGAGPDPIYLPQPGRREDPVFLTTGYRGAPFGLEILTHAEAGPFNLGDISVRAALTVDPHTGQLTIKSDPLPTIEKGIPLDIRTVNIAIDREGFTFNPTDCGPLAVNGTLVSTQHTSVGVSSHFEASSCAGMPFAPAFAASTRGNASFNGNGASLTVRITAHGGPPSDPATRPEANIKRVDVQLPKALPARLSTLQQACPDSVFAQNPAACPGASDVGTARALTPVLPVPVEGPVYLVSHGGKAFPELVIVLQGYGVTVQLEGETNIANGITYSKFESAPDVPITSLELSVPESPHSALASPGGNLCGQTLTMPTTIEAQNGAIRRQNTQVAVTGCAPNVTVVKRKLTGNNLRLTLKVTVAGTLTIAGAPIKRYSKHVTAGTHEITLTLSRSGRATHQRHHKLRLTIALKTPRQTITKTDTA